MAATAPAEISQQMRDNITWIRGARANRLVVGSQARILYADAEGRSKIAQAFNDAVKSGRLTAPVVLGRDHHDVSGTDSPYRETSNILAARVIVLTWPCRTSLAMLSVVQHGFRF